MTQIQPGTPEWDATVERIIELEHTATQHTNAARDALLEQGDEFNHIAPMGQRGKSNGSKALLEQLARDAGIDPETAKNRRDVAAQMGPGTHLVEIRETLRNASDVLVSFGTLRTIVADHQPEALLQRLITEAREAGKTRIARDDVRRARGMVTGTVGTPQATAERMAADPDFRREVLESVTDPEARREVASTAMGNLDDETRDKVYDEAIGITPTPQPVHTPKPTDDGLVSERTILPHRLRIMVAAEHLLQRADTPGYWTRAEAQEALRTIARDIEAMAVDAEFDGIVEANQ